MSLRVRKQAGKKEEQESALETSGRSVLTREATEQTEGAAKLQPKVAEKITGLFKTHGAKIGGSMASYTSPLRTVTESHK